MSWWLWIFNKKKKKKFKKGEVVNMHWAKKTPQKQKTLMIIIITVANYKPYLQWDVHEYEAAWLLKTAF